MAKQEMTAVDAVFAKIKQARKKGASRVEICEALGIEAGTAARALVKLRGEERIYSEGVTRNTRYFVS